METREEPNPWRYRVDVSSPRLPNSAHTDRPWRIHELTRDFELEDVWALPTPGDREDFHALIRGVTSMDPGKGTSRAVRALFALRWKLGEWFGWDAEDDGLGSRVPTLRDRLPTDLRGAASAPHPALPFKPVYLLEDEYAAEIANRTVHAVMHVSWVQSSDGGYRGQKAIAPFRHLIVYPAMIREIEREWPRRRTELRNAG